MAIQVRFSPNGFNHPLYGRLGRGKNLNRIYTLPDAFGEKETVKVPVMDNSSKPPKQIGEKEITRWKNLPSDAEVIDEDHIADLEERSNEGDLDARGELEDIRNAGRPEVSQLVDESEEQKKLHGQGQAKKAKAMSATERTTGKAQTKKPKRRSARKTAS